MITQLEVQIDQLLKHQFSHYLKCGLIPQQASEGGVHAVMQANDCWKEYLVNSLDFQSNWMERIKYKMLKFDVKPKFSFLKGLINLGFTLVKSENKLFCLTFFHHEQYVMN